MDINSLCECDKKIEKSYGSIYYKTCSGGRGFWVLHFYGEDYINIWDRAKDDEISLKRIYKYYKNRAPSMLEKRIEKGLFNCVDCKKPIMTIEDFKQLVLLQKYSSSLQQDLVHFLEQLKAKTTK